MTTKVLFVMDKNLKEKAMKKARSFGLPFSSVLNLATKAFVDGKLNIEMVEEERQFNNKTTKTLNKILKEIEQGKNIVGPFKTTKEIMRSLEL